MSFPSSHLAAELHPLDVPGVIPRLQGQLPHLQWLGLAAGSGMDRVWGVTSWPVGSWKLKATVSIQQLSVFLGSSTYPLHRQVVRGGAKNKVYVGEKD